VVADAGAMLKYLRAAVAALEEGRDGFHIVAAYNARAAINNSGVAHAECRRAEGVIDPPGPVRSSARHTGGGAPGPGRQLVLL